MNSDEINLLVQEINFCFMAQTKILVEAMPCLCKSNEFETTNKDGTINSYYGGYCNRCLKLGELK